tara:strand:- start:402 stop:752 length:351 start_codon:yes stop_codon:yes gene_type:complete
MRLVIGGIGWLGKIYNWPLPIMGMKKRVLQTFVVIFALGLFLGAVQFAHFGGVTGFSVFEEGYGMQQEEIKWIGFGVAAFLVVFVVGSLLYEIVQGASGASSGGERRRLIGLNFSN